MKVYDSGHRYDNYYKWDGLKNQPYDYARNGLINKLLSQKILDTKNRITQNILTFYEQSIIFMLKYVDRLKQFKDLSVKNR